MPNALEIIKKAALDAVENNKPTDVEYGTVETINPLSVRINQQRVYPVEFLVLTRNVTDFETEVTVDWQTENKSGGGGYESFSSHNHAIVGRKKMIVHNGLKVGEKVALVRLAGAQEFLIIDRVVS